MQSKYTNNPEEMNISPYFGNPDKVKEITDMLLEIFISDPNHDNPDFSFTNP